MRQFRLFKSSLLAAAAVGVVGVAQAQTEDDLEARIRALEAMVSELKDDLAEQKAASDESIVRVEEVRQQTSEAIAAMGGPSEATGFRVGDTLLSFGGFVDFDLHVTDTSDGTIASGSIARDFLIPGATPVGGEGNTTTDFTAEASRFFLKGSQNVNGMPVTGYIEVDFLGSLQGNERVSSSFSPRLRRAYIDIDGTWRIGQEWSTFQNTSAIPESASFLVSSDGMVFMRQAQIRYTNGNWQFAVENGNATITPLGGGRIEADNNIVPDFVARYNFTGDYGNVSVAAIARQLRIDMMGLDDETFGYGLSVSGRVNVGERDDIRFNLVGGEGLGRYVGLNSANGAAFDSVTTMVDGATLTTAGDLEAIPSFGGYLAWRHPFGETARLNVGYSGLFIDNPDFLGGGTTKQTQSVFGAVLWDVSPKVTLGTELLYGIRELENGTEGEIARFTFSTKYAF